jgi:glutathionylspermidine synthase
MTPWTEGAALTSDRYHGVRKRVIFECGKWDPQVEDANTIADRPIVLTAAAWQELAATAEALHAEAMAAETELALRPRLQRKLGIPRRLRAALEHAGAGRTDDVRVMRFDFHHTTGGWMISEVNSDVPGGFNEAGGMARLFAELYTGTRVAGDPAAELARRIARNVGDKGVVALIHATAYTDDRQVMLFLARALEREGLTAVLAGPDAVTWRDGGPRLLTDAYAGRVDHLVRFFPVEWMPNLDDETQWQYYLGNGAPASNPGRAVLCQTKRFPLVWRELETKLPTWQRVLPESRCPRTVDWEADPGWVPKPAFGRVGGGVGLRECVAAREWVSIVKSARRYPDEWIVQRRFDAVPTPSGLYPCFGVYTVDGRAAGVYGRAAPRPLVDHRAMDIAVLVEQEAA